MRLNQTTSVRQIARPVILGAGLTGLAISRALSAADVEHVLVGDQPADTPRLGESLNAEGSLEIARQFPDLSQFFTAKREQTLFFGGNTLAFDFPQFAAGRAYESLLGYPPTVQPLHVDRVGFDRALFETATADEHCLSIEDRATSLDYQPASDRIVGVRLTGGETVVPSYVFDATNGARFVARQLGVICHRIGEARRVVFAHYRAGDKATVVPPPWAQATSLLRLGGKKDPVEGLAWCIPLSNYVSLGISVDPTTTGANPALLMDWVEKAYEARGLDVRGAFPGRGAPVDLRNEHYNHERCYGRNWMLAGLSCCQFWFSAAAGVATGLVAARLAPDVLRAPSRAPALYQSYLDEVAVSHAGLDWLVRDDPESLTADALRRRSEGMVAGNIRRLGHYLALQAPPPELAFGDTLSRLYQSDRLLANPSRVDTAPRAAQATRLFATPTEPDPWTDAPMTVPVLTRPDKLDGPPSILGLVDVLSGRREVGASADLATANVKVQIDQFLLQGVRQWEAWATFLRGSPRVSQLELVAGSLTGSGSQWVLAGQWQGVKGGLATVSPQFSVTFVTADDQVSSVQMQRADCTFVLGDSILPQVAFAVLLGQMLGQEAA